METIKTQLLSKSLEKVEETIATNTAILKRLQEALVGEGKSSAGDKFETSRAMLQSDIDRHHTLLLKAKKQKHLLTNVSLSINATVKTGSLVMTDKAHYFFAAPIGKITLDNSYYVLSINSPLGQVMLGKTKGDRISYNSNTFTILDIN